jgi:hypothetical protein
MIKIYFCAIVFLTFSNLINAQIPTGAVGDYQLNNNTATDQSGNNYNGSLSGTTNDADRFSTANSAVAFVAGTGSGSFPSLLVTAIQNDFTIGFWFKTTMTANSHSQWYGGSALVDAEMCGGTSDFGMSLIDGGKVCVGIGGSDITLKSPESNYNDGNWHFITATRNAATGVVKLYLEGLEVASTTASTAARTAPTSIRMGSNPCAPGGVYTGSLDDVIFYDRVLTTTEVGELYTASSVLPLRWISVSGSWQRSKALLKWEVGNVLDNDRFEIERSTNGINFTTVGSVPNNSGFAGAAASVYNFSDNFDAAKGTIYYRIKQVDKDGRFSYSKTIKLLADNSAKEKITLRSNPVTSDLIVLNEHHVQVTTINIVDASGKIVASKIIKKADSIIRYNVQQLPAGYYIAMIASSDGNTALAFIKQ